MDDDDDDDDGLMMFMIMMIIFMMLVSGQDDVDDFHVACHVKPLSCSAIHTHRLCTWDEINVKLLSN